MTRRLWRLLQGEPAEMVCRSPTGARNEVFRAAWAGHYADRALLLFTFIWFGIRVYNWRRIQLRPEEIYDPQIWLANLVFPTLPSSAFWYALLTLGIIATIICLLRPRLIWARLILAVDLLVLLTPELGFGHVMHPNHLFLLAHVYSAFRPLGAPANLERARLQSAGYSWFLLGLLAVYTASGVWKVVDMTIRDVLKPGVTWLDEEGMLSTSIAAMRNADLSMAVPQAVDALAWAFPVGYVLLTIIFTASFVAAFRRPLLFVVLPTVIAFHVLNAVAMRVLFVPTIFIATVVFLPYDFLIPAVRRRLTAPHATTLIGAGFDARYERRYEGGDIDIFLRFYAYREWLRDRSAILAAPLYFPGLAWIGNHVLRLRRSPVRNEV